MEEPIEETVQTYRPRRHIIRNTLIGIACLAGAAIYGDAKNVNSITINDISLESMFWSGTPAAEGTPADYHNYKPKIEIDEDGNAHLYFGNIRTEKFMAVHEDGRVGTFADRKKYFLEKLSQQTQEKVDEIIQSEPYQKTTSTLKRWYETAKQSITDFVDEHFGE
ncbi:MAG: hypothetical protein ABIE94_00710 [archaeon]